MTFLYPNFLYALFLIAIPIIVHFFNFRRYKKLEFTNVLLLKKAQKVNKNFNKLKSWLILLFRILTISALVLAFAQPVSTNYNAQSSVGKYVTIFIDNSFSMTSSAKDGALLELAKQQALDLLNAYGSKEQFKIISDSKGSSAQFVEKAFAKDQIASISLSSQSIDLTSIYNIFDGSNKNSDQYDYYIFSDFQKSTFNLESKYQIDSLIPKVVWLPVQASVPENICIDSAWFEQAVLEVGTVAELHYRIKNYAQVPKNDINVNLYVNENQRGISTISLAAEESQELSIKYKISDKGWNKAMLQVDDFPIEFDNEFYLTYLVRDEKKVLLVDESGKNYLSRAFATEEGFQVSKLVDNQLSVADFTLYDLIILNESKILSRGIAERFTEYLNQGGNVLYVPQSGQAFSDKLFLEAFGIQSSGKFQDLNVAVSSLNTESGFFINTFDELPKNVILPKLQSYQDYSYKIAVRFENLLQLPNGKPFLSQLAIGQGYFYISAVPYQLNYSNFPNSSLFLPIHFQMATLSQTASSYSTFIGGNAIKLAVTKVGQDEVYKLTNPTFEFIPKQKFINSLLQISVHDHEMESGFYNLTSSIGDSIISVIGLNYNRSESNPSIYSIDELKKFAEFWNANILVESGENLSVQVLESIQGKTFWKWFIAFALFFILLEILTIKFLNK